jgi:hypothetical protein
MNQLCKRCIIPANATNVEIGSDGVCNLCKTYDRLRPLLTDFPNLEKLRNERFERVRGKHQYDALVGLSGGKDSSYVAYKLVREHGLKILMMTYDNGFLSDIAHRNIDIVAKELKQNHIYMAPELPLHKAICRESLRRFGVPCLGCTFPGFAAAIKLAVEKEIPLLVHGRSRPQMFKDLAPGAVDPHLPFLEGNLSTADRERNRRFLTLMSKKLNRAMKGFAGQKEHAAEVARLFQIDIERIKIMTEPPEFMGYFLYEDNDEETIRQELQTAIGWSRPDGPHLEGHEDCRVHPAAAYLYTLDHGYSLPQQELAAAVRTGALTREAALARLERNTHLTHLSAEAMAELSSFSGVPKDKILGYAHRVRKLLSILRMGLRARNLLMRPWLNNRLPLKPTNKG